MLWVCQRYVYQLTNKGGMIFSREDVSGGVSKVCMRCVGKQTCGQHHMASGLFKVIASSFSCQYTYQLALLITDTGFIHRVGEIIYGMCV